MVSFWRQQASPGMFFSWKEKQSREDMKEGRLPEVLIPCRALWGSWVLIHTIWENLLTQVLSCISCISCISSRSHSSSLDCTNRWISALHILSAAVMLVLSFLKWVLDKPYKLINWFLPIASVPISRRAFKFKHLGSGYRCFPKIPGFYELMPSAQKMHPFLDCLVAAHHRSRHILWRL